MDPAKDFDDIQRAQGSDGNVIDPTPDEGQAELVSWLDFVRAIRRVIDKDALRVEFPTLSPEQLEAGFDYLERLFCLPFR